MGWFSSAFNSVRPGLAPLRESSKPPDHPWITSHRAGVLHIVFPAEAKDGDLERFCSELGAFWQRAQGTVGLLIDCRKVRVTSSEQRRMLIEFRKRTAPLVAQKVSCGAYLADSALQRGLLSAILLVRPPSYPYRTFPEPSSALRWLDERMGTTGRTVPPS
ncbi:MAG TPA: hypothetical protein VLC09_16930 [Polyangiaceae bacterium]|nr:hypothetical protein [Polyangiaceae bacterium]